MNDTDARLWHPWLRINRVLRVMLHTRWSAEAWVQVRVEFRKALALRSQIRARGLAQLIVTDAPGRRRGRSRLDDVFVGHAVLVRVVSFV
jgi:hypothetical protein